MLDRISWRFRSREAGVKKKKIYLYGKAINIKKKKKTGVMRRKKGQRERRQRQTHTRTALRQSSSAKPPPRPSPTHPYCGDYPERESCRQTEEPILSPTACSTHFALLCVLCVCPLLSMHECACECARDGACPATPKSSAHPFTEKNFFFKKSFHRLICQRAAEHQQPPPKRSYEKHRHTHRQTTSPRERCCIAAVSQHVHMNKPH